MLTDIHFVNPEYFLLLLLIPVLAYWYLQKDRFATLQMSSLAAFGGKPSLRGRLSILLPLLRLLAFILLVVALARPRLNLQEQEINAEGIDIIMAIDLSSSMLAKDFKPDRLGASKAVAAEFIEKRPYDRIGLTVFAAESYTKCPATTDHQVMKQFLSELECGVLEDGTAIGMGLATAVKALAQSEAKSKVVILLTDGVNNAGYVQPLMAAEIAKTFKVKVYTIGVGSMTDALTPIGRRGDGQYIFGFAPVRIDEDLLVNVAEMTEGKYFRATDETSLKAIYQEIDELEKTKLEITVIKRHSEEYFLFALLAMILIGVEILLRYTIFRTIP